MSVQTVRVGVGVLILRANKVLFGKRKGTHESGTWAPPGGHLEFGETFIECARREVFEETGLRIKNPRLAPVTEDVYPEKGKHYITVFVVVDCPTGTPRVREPDKVENWRWYDWNAVPKPYFLPVANLKKKRFNPVKYRPR